MQPILFENVGDNVFCDRLGRREKQVICSSGRVRRLVAFMAENPFATHEKLPSLFELAPFLSDVDLQHTGTSHQTAGIRKAILSSVPFAENFRWDIFSEEELTK